MKRIFIVMLTIAMATTVTGGETELDRLRIRYQQALEQAAAPIHRSYRQQLIELQGRLTRQGKLDEAIVVRDELAAFDEKQGAKPTASNTTRLVGPVKNIAKNAKATVSSYYGSQGADNLTDGIIKSSTNNQGQWVASRNDRIGAWAKLEWQKPVTVDRIVVFDRHTIADHITDATVELSDGTKLKTGPLPNDASSGKELKLRKPTKVTWVKVTVDSGQFVYTGLAELEVYGR